MLDTIAALLHSAAAAGDPTDLSWQTYLFAYGPAAGILATVLGVLFRAITTGKLVSGTEHNRVVAELAAEKAANAVLNESIRKEYVPAMTRFVDLMTSGAAMRGRG